MRRAVLYLPVAVCVLFFSSQLFAVSEAAVLSLIISPSPQANAMGQTYGALWSQDPMSSAVNPAAVGLYAQTRVAGYAYYPVKTSWLPAFGNDLWLDSKAFILGFNLQSVTKLPVSIGLARFEAGLDLGDRAQRNQDGDIIGMYEAYEKYNNTTLSAAIDYYLHAGIGYTFKDIDSKLGPAPNGGEARVQTNAHDLGLIIQAPLADIMSKLGKPVAVTPKLLPFLTPGFSWSKRHIGDAVNYIDSDRQDPLPRQAIIGVNFDAGLQYKDKRQQFEVLHFRWAREAEDLLINRQDSGDWEYTSGLQDIKFWDNVILGKANENAVMHRGYQIGLADVVFIRRGHYENIEGRVTFNASGFGVNFIQPLRIIATFLDYKQDNLWLNILLNLDVEYHQSAWDVEEGHPLAETEFKGVTISLGNWFF